MSVAWDAHDLCKALPLLKTTFKGMQRQAVSKTHQVVEDAVLVVHFRLNAMCDLHQDQAQTSAPSSHKETFISASLRLWSPNIVLLPDGGNWSAR